MSLQATDKFERLNPEISVNVFGFDAISKVYPLRISKFKRRKEIDLMLLENKHYCQKFVETNVNANLKTSWGDCDLSEMSQSLSKRESFGKA